MRRVSLLVAVLVGLIGGCGGSGDDEGRAAQAREPRIPATADASRLPGACDLLTEADVVAAFGERVTPGPQSTDECWWSTANDLKTVNLIRRTDDLATWRAGYDNDFWTPNDLGDEGYTGKALTSVVWRMGEVQYEVNVVYSTRGKPEQVVQTLAEQALGRL